jgi:hypothetical protein
MYIKAFYGVDRALDVTASRKKVRPTIKPWDLKETYDLARARWGRDQERLVNQSARSINDRKNFASYHFREAMRLSAAFERRHLAGHTTFLEIYAEGAEKKRRAFEWYMIKAGAHALAAVQCLHALPDILAHSIYFGAGQNLQPHALPDREISLQSVATALKRDRSFAALSSKLRRVQSGTGWRHLAAVANMSKHRSVIRSALNEDWTGARHKVRELHVTSFERGPDRFPAVSLRDLLEPEFDRLSIAIVEIGNELNQRLRSLP